MHHLNIRKTPAGRILAQRKDGKLLTSQDHIEAKYLAVADEPMDVGSEDGPLPYFDEFGCLIIPFSSPKRFHWWRPKQSGQSKQSEQSGWSGQSILETVSEIRGTLK
jgi:hypothetical protein